MRIALIGIGKIASCQGEDNTILSEVPHRLFFAALSN